MSDAFAGLLATIFIGLKLTGYVTWSWWWVLSPIWLPFFALAPYLIFILAVTIFFASRTG